MNPTPWTALALLPAFAACAATVRTADRGDVPAPTDAYLVQVHDEATPAGLWLVSASAWEVHPADDLPLAAPGDVIDAMCASAAARGATRLYLERVDAPWRKAFFGFGAVSGPDPAVDPPDPRCSHPSYLTAATAAGRTAERCLARLQRARPALQGEVTVVFQVDPWGRVMRAAPTPDSTRDGEAQACAIAALTAADFGPPPGFSCSAAITVRLATPPQGAP